MNKLDLTTQNPTRKSEAVLLKSIDRYLTTVL